MRRRLDLSFLILPCREEDLMCHTAAAAAVKVFIYFVFLPGPPESLRAHSVEPDLHYGFDLDASPEW